MRFVRYGKEWGEGNLDLEGVLKDQAENRMLWARVESSGSEGIYVEVAKWNEKSHQWQRWAFCKFENAKDPKAHKVAKQINSGMFPWMSVIHIMPQWDGDDSTDTRKALDATDAEAVEAGYDKLASGFIGTSK